MNDLHELTDSEIDGMLDSMEFAWGIIANAYGGDWDKAPPEWKKAAERWRDEHWHPLLSKVTA